jgi:hypothetical protein
MMTEKDRTHMLLKYCHRQASPTTSSTATTIAASLPLLSSKIQVLDGTVGNLEVPSHTSVASSAFPSPVSAASPLTPAASSTQEEVVSTPTQEVVSIPTSGTPSGSPPTPPGTVATPPSTAPSPPGTVATSQPPYFFQVDLPYGLVCEQAEANFLKHSEDKMRSVLVNGGALKPVNSFSEHSMFNAKNVSHLNANNSVLVQIFKCSFWVDAVGQSPRSGQMITHHQVTNFVWRPVDFHNNDFCRYITEEMEKEGLCLEVRNHQRTVLFVFDGQQDFCDGIPALVPVDQLEAHDGQDDTDTNSDESRPARAVDSSTTVHVPPFADCKGVANEPSSSQLTEKSQGLQTAPEPELVWQKRLQRNAEVTDRVSRRKGVLVGLKVKVVINEENGFPTPGNEGSCFSKTHAEVYWLEKVSTRNLYLHDGGVLDESAAMECFVNVRLVTDARKRSIARRGIIHCKPRKGSPIVEVRWLDEPPGKLALVGSFADFERLKTLLTKNVAAYDDIYLSRDCHRIGHIAHKAFWKSDKDVPLDPQPGCFPVIRYVDVLTGRYQAKDRNFTVGF